MLYQLQGSSSINQGGPCFLIQWHVWLHSLQKSKCIKSPNASARGKAPLVSETAWTFSPSFISYTLQLRYTRSLGHISRTLNIYPVLSRNDPVFETCREGDLVGLQAVVSREGVSVFVTDDRGSTLLHVSIKDPQPMVHDYSLTDFSMLQDTTDPKYVIGYYRLE